jgi:hypothetical protein
LCKSSLLGTRQKEQDVEPKATDFMSGVLLFFWFFFNLVENKNNKKQFLL